jgi:hypothetical protein
MIVRILHAGTRIAAAAVQDPQISEQFRMIWS